MQDDLRNASADLQACVDTTTSTTRGSIALIGAGPSGLAGARNLQKLGIPFQGVEAYTDVGGLWNIANPRSTV